MAEHRGETGPGCAEDHEIAHTKQIAQSLNQQDGLGLGRVAKQHAHKGFPVPFLLDDAFTPSMDTQKHMFDDHDVPSTPASFSSSMLDATTRATSPDLYLRSSHRSLLGHAVHSRCSSLSTLDEDTPAFRARSHTASMSMDSGFVSMEVAENKSCASRSIRAESEVGDDYEHVDAFGQQGNMSQAGDVDMEERSFLRTVEDVRSNLETTSLDGSDRTLSATSTVSSDGDDSNHSCFSDDMGIAETDHILSVILPLIRGISPQSLANGTLELCRNATATFGQVLAAILDRDIGTSDHGQSQADADASPGSGTARGSSDGGEQQGKEEKPNGNRKGRGSRKRKSDSGREEGNGDGSNLDGDQSGPSDSPAKRLNSGLRLRCPFRARNPHRFNVRDYHSCAMTYYTAFSDLRVHVAKKHSRENPTKFLCQRCNMSFKDNAELQFHVKLPEACKPRDLDPEDGVDEGTMMRITNRKRACGPSEQEQWEDLYSLIFPDDEKIPPYDFTPVVENFEFVANYLERLSYFQPFLGDFVITADIFEILCERIRQDLRYDIQQALSISDMKAREMDYKNRNSTKRGGVNNSINPLLAQWALSVSPRDSAIMMDNVSMRSSAVFNPGNVAQGSPPSSQNFGIPAQPEQHHPFQEGFTAVPTAVTSSGVQQPAPQALFRGSSSNILNPPAVRFPLTASGTMTEGFPPLSHLGSMFDGSTLNPAFIGDDMDFPSGDFDQMVSLPPDFEDIEENGIDDGGTGGRF